MLFLYEGDSYYDLSDWTKFESRVAAVPELKVVKLSRIEVMKICPRRCDRDSHGAVWGDGFEGALGKGAWLGFDTWAKSRTRRAHAAMVREAILPTLRRHPLHATRPTRPC